MRLNQITEHAISEFQRLRIDALEKENAKLKQQNTTLDLDNIELKNANKLAHENINARKRFGKKMRKQREALEKENISLSNAKHTLLSKCSEFEQTIANLKRDLVSRQTR